MNGNSGQFMISQFEAEADDDEIEMAPTTATGVVALQMYQPHKDADDVICKYRDQELSIETSLSKLFNCMKLAYKQKLTSPKWNRFKGIRLRWGTKIRLNNLIWRCWHMQFIMKKNTSCQFASPLDCDIHSQPEAVVLEGKYWKREYNVISAEYKKWRRFYHRTIDPNNALEALGDSDLDWISYGDKCLMNAEDNQWTSDLLFSTISQPFAFPDQREIARFGGIADFIQPSLGPLQPNIGEFMDTFDPLELLNANNRLPSVPEEGPDEFLRSINFYGGGDLNALDETFPWSGTAGSSSSASGAVAGGVGGAVAAETSNKVPSRTEVKGVVGVVPENTATNRIGGGSAMYLTGGAAATAAAIAASAPNGMMLPRRDMHHQSPADESQQMDLSLMEQNYVKEQQQASPQVQYTAQMYTQALPRGGAGDVVAYASGGSNNSNLMPLSQVGADGLFGKAPASNLLKALDQQQQLQQGVVRLSAGQQHPLRQFIRREAHNYDKQLPTAHQTLMYTQIINEQLQSEPQTANNPPHHHHQQHALHSRSNSLEQSYQQQSQELSKADGGGGPSYMFKTIDDVHMIGLPPAGDEKEFGRSNSLPVNASLHMMTTTGGGGGMSTRIFDGTVEGVSEGLQTAQIRVGENQFISPRNKVQQKYHMGATAAGGGGGLQAAVSSQHLSQMNRQHGQFNAMQTANSEPALVQLLQKHGGSAGGISKDQLHGQRPYPHVVKLEKSSSFHVTTADTNNNCDGEQQQQQQQLSKAGLAFVQHLATTTTAAASGMHSPGTASATTVGGGESKKKKNLPSPVVSPVTSSGSPDASMMEVAMKLNMGKKEEGVGSDLLLANVDSQSKRSGHIYAEQKRRIHIKNGFDLLHSLIPQLQQSSSSASKMSKAAVLQKGAEYIKQLKVERVATNEKMERLRKERDALNNQISLLHSALPANGAPVSRQRTGKIMDMYNQYVLNRTYEHWKFWIFGFLFEPLLLSFNATVSVASMEDLQRTAMLWVDQNCSLVELRPAITNKLRYLSTTTDILSDEPSTIKDEVMKVINRASLSSSSSSAVPAVAPSVVSASTGNVIVSAASSSGVSGVAQQHHQQSPSSSSSAGR